MFRQAFFLLSAMNRVEDFPRFHTPPEKASNPDRVRYFSFGSLLQGDSHADSKGRMLAPRRLSAKISTLITVVLRRDQCSEIVSRSSGPGPRGALTITRGDGIGNVLSRAAAEVD